MHTIEKIKSKILLQALSNELEYHFDIDYNSKMSYEERKENFPLLVEEYLNMPILKLIEQYGEDYFTLTHEESSMIETLRIAEKA